MKLLVFFCKQKTAYEMLISDGSSDVCSSDLLVRGGGRDDPPLFAPGVMQAVIDRSDIAGCKIVLSIKLQPEPDRPSSGYWRRGSPLHFGCVDKVWVIIDYPVLLLSQEFYELARSLC